MGTLADKLNKTYDTKQQIAAAIEEMTGKNPGTVFADYPAAIRSISTGGRGWTGHADVEGLKAIGWTDDDIAYYQEHGVNWNEEETRITSSPKTIRLCTGSSTSTTSKTTRTSSSTCRRSTRAGKLICLKCSITYARW